MGLTPKQNTLSGLHFGGPQTCKVLLRKTQKDYYSVVCHVLSNQFEVVHRILTDVAIELVLLIPWKQYVFFISVYSVNASWATQA